MCVPQLRVTSGRKLLHTEEAHRPRSGTGDSTILIFVPERLIRPHYATPQVLCSRGCRNTSRDTQVECHRPPRILQS